MQKPDGNIPKVALIFSTRLKGVRTICRGVLAYARAHGPWRCQLLEGRDGEQGIALKNLAIDGVIAQLEAFDDASLRAKVTRDSAAMAKLVQAHFHCG